MLYLVSTPIGNLEDLSFRAVRVLKSCDYILCEDTRKSKYLLEHYEIQRPLVAFHKFNERKREITVLEDLKKDLSIALISDAGTPCICDPGASLIKLCIEQGLSYTAIPGACSILQALLLSGFVADSFQFLGFLPKKKGQREKILQSMLLWEGISLCFESPHRILSTLEILQKLAPEKTIAIAREMTKKFEECLRNTPENLLKHFEKHVPKGEMVLILPPAIKERKKKKFFRPEE